MYTDQFLQRVSIACYAKRCISNRKSKTTEATITGSSVQDSPTTLVSSWLPSARNSKGNIGSEGAE